MKTLKNKNHYLKNSITNTKYDNIKSNNKNNITIHNKDFNEYNDRKDQIKNFNFNSKNDDDSYEMDFSISWIDDLNKLDENEDLENNNFAITDKILPLYMVKNKGFTPDENILLDNIRNQLVDLAISTKKTKEIGKVQDIKNILQEKVSGNTDLNYIDDLSIRIYENINGYGLINPLISDDELEEIMVIGSNKPVYVYHRKYGMMETNLKFDEDVEIIRIIDSIARANNRRFDNESPIFDGRLKDGSRVNGTLPPVSADGPTLTIRKFRHDSYTIIDLINHPYLTLLYLQY